VLFCDVMGFRSYDGTFYMRLQITSVPFLLERGQLYVVIRMAQSFVSSYLTLTEERFSFHTKSKSTRRTYRQMIGLDILLCCDDGFAISRKAFVIVYRPSDMPFEDEKIEMLDSLNGFS
jgi:hypothetical protein